MSSLTRGKRRWRRILWTLGTLIVALPLLYTLVGFVGVPLIVQKIVLPRIGEHLHGQIAITKVAFNPYTLRLGLDELVVEDKQGQIVLACQHIEAKARFATLWSDGYRLAHVMLEEPYVHAVIDEGLRLNLLTLIREAPTPDAEPFVLPRLVIERLSVDSGSVVFDDRAQAEPFRKRFEDITFSVDRFDTDPLHPNPHRLTTTTEQGEGIAWQGQLRLNPATLEGRLEVRQLDLSRYTPYLAGRVDLRINGGILSTDVTAKLATTGRDEPPTLHVTLEETRLDRIDLDVIGAMAAKATADQLHIDRIEADLATTTIEVNRVLMRGGRGVLAGRLAPDDHKPVADIRGDAPAPPGNAAVPPGHTGWTLRVAEIGLTDQHIHLSAAAADLTANGQDTLELLSLGGLSLVNLQATTQPLALAIELVKVQRPNLLMQLDEQGRPSLPWRSETAIASDADAAESLSQPGSEPMPPASADATTTALALTIDTVEVTEGTLVARDLSQQPRFEIALDELDGQVAGLALTSTEPVTFTWRGVAAGVAPFVAEGRVNPDPAARMAELNVSLNDLGLDVFDTYARRYLGHAIDRGRLNLLVTYRIEGSRLTAEHRLHFDRFYLGQATRHPDRLQLPIQLALGLLRDPQGQMRLNVPARGDLDDPQFRWTHLIFQAFFNTLTNVASSPFQFIASILGADDQDLSYVAFEGGSARLSPAAADTLNLLQRAMIERPAIRLSVRGIANRDADGPAIRRRLLLADVQRELARQLPENDPRRADPPNLAVSRDAYRTAVLARYQALTEGQASDETDEAELAAVEAVRRQVTPPRGPRVQVRAGGRVRVVQQPTAPRQADASPLVIVPEAVDETDGSDDATASPPEVDAASEAEVEPDDETEAAFQRIEARVLAAMAVPDEALATLARQREEAVMRHLLASQRIESDRIAGTGAAPAAEATADDADDATGAGVEPAPPAAADDSGTLGPSVRFELQ